MNDISDLEERILQALDRIGTKMAGRQDAQPVNALLGHGAPTEQTSIEVDVLKAELEAERSANTQLNERLRAIKDKQETLLSGLERKVGQLSLLLDQQGSELQRQRLINVSLTRANQKLSDALREGLSDPDLLNQTMVTELEAMRVARASELAEMEEIMAELRPLIGEVA